MRHIQPLVNAAYAAQVTPSYTNGARPDFTADCRPSHVSISSYLLSWLLMLTEKGRAHLSRPTDICNILEYSEDNSAPFTDNYGQMLSLS